MSKVLIIYGHTRKQSFAHELGSSYARAAAAKGNEVRELYLCDEGLDKYLNYPHDMSVGMFGGQENYPQQVKDFHKLLLWADRYVFAFPLWWGLPPALVKTFIEIAFAPKVAFKYLPPKGQIPRWEKLLKGKTARVLVSADSTSAYYKFFTGNAIGKAFKSNILGFCGVKTLGVNYFGSVKMSNEEKRKTWLEKASKLGSTD